MTEFDMVTEVKVKGKGSGFIQRLYWSTLHSRRSGRLRITQCYLQITPYLPLPRKHSPDGASPDWGCGHL